MAEALSRYAIGAGDRADEDSLVDADRSLETELRTRGFQRAKVSHRLSGANRARLNVDVYAYARVRFRFEGNRHFDASQLENVLDVEGASDLAPAALAEKIAKFYRERGFLDVDIGYSERGLPSDPIQDVVFDVREGKLVHVVAREYPCLTGARTPAEVGSEIDSFLAELPGGRLFDAVDPAVLDALQGPTSETGARPAAEQLSPWAVYASEVYERAIKHVQDLYRSEGYLSASVGPVQVLRRACALHSPAGQCLPVGPPRRPATACRYDSVGLPLEEAAIDATLSCVPDPKRGLKCEPSIVLHLPIKLGPRATLYDLGFEGNRAIVEKELEKIADIELGTPVSQVEIEKARRRVLDEYAERGFAFAEVESALDLSLDHTRARVRFIVSEREQVRVSRIVVHGAERTSESLIRSRLALEVGGLYQRSLVRKTEERLATLGVFSQRQRRLRRSLCARARKSRGCRARGTGAAVPRCAPRLQHRRRVSSVLRIRASESGRASDPAHSTLATRLPARRRSFSRATCSRSTTSCTSANAWSGATRRPSNSRASGSGRCSD